MVSQVSIDFPFNLSRKYNKLFLTSHAGHHKTNGEIGAIIVRQPKRNEKHHDEYDDDLPQHHIVISDWMDTHAEQYVPGLRQTDGVLPDNLLLNGRGIRRTRPNIAAQYQTPLEVFRIRKGRRYRFRLINAMSHICPTGNYPRVATNDFKSKYFKYQISQSSQQLKLRSTVFAS